MMLLACHGKHRRCPRRRRGAVIVLFSILLIVVMALLALSLDLGYMCSVKADLQGAVDAGALAGSGVILDGASEATSTAKRFTDLNLTNSGVPVRANGQDVTVELGHWDFKSRVFHPSQDPLDAVKVTARVDNASLFFGRVVGTGRFSTERSAVVYFLEYLREAKAKDRVGFSYYSTYASMGSKLSFDLTSVETEMLKHLQPSGWTNIADGMQLALDEFASNRRAQALPLMVLLTDGAANMNQPGNWNNPTEAKARVIQRAESAARERIPIFTMALDSQTSEVDVALMARVGAITASESYHILAGQQSGQSTELREAFRRVAANRPLRIVD
jgi:hypothetical protein